MYDRLKAKVGCLAVKISFQKRNIQKLPKITDNFREINKKHFRNIVRVLGNFKYIIMKIENRKDVYSVIIKDPNIEEQFKMYLKICFRLLGITMKGSKRKTSISGFFFAFHEKYKSRIKKN